MRIDDPIDYPYQYLSSLERGQHLRWCSKHQRTVAMTAIAVIGHYSKLIYDDYSHHWLLKSARWAISVINKLFEIISVLWLWYLELKRDE